MKTLDNSNQWVGKWGVRHWHLELIRMRDLSDTLSRLRNPEDTKEPVDHDNGD